MKNIINTEAAPAAIGPYSQGVTFGDLVMTSVAAGSGHHGLPGRRGERTDPPVADERKSRAGKIGCFAGYGT